MKAFFKKNIITCLSLAISGAIISDASIAAPRVTVQEYHYTVSGRTMDEIKQAISKQAPLQNDGNNFSALTKYDIGWNYTFDKSGKNCKIATVTTSVVITHNFPKLENVNQLDMTTQTEWGRYLASLQTHEEKHADLGIEAAGEIEKEIAKIKPQSSCTKLSIEANNIARNIINYYHNKNADYDKETVHGLLQGTTLSSYRTF
ncbi:MAG: DUF922 domain-containing protein [Rickettsiales bacterium]|nr:DUF922 domain-containing protein [Pseudomonadota bacterium]MDA0966127.1 DUF922 domain-containing protein [Pseudomonadota bacterium]MDG4543208.1 DUF922 domain-containing protein [Rickettsiales bacterium]MDG4545406.1 DUF922 domain-containing protein [Rickettsiales bacterium]MDG4547855.1 DUF922 domain-containing protein [Rickettsiales bacterium]